MCVCNKYYTLRNVSNSSNIELCSVKKKKVKKLIQRWFIKAQHLFSEMRMWSQSDALCLSAGNGRDSHKMLNMPETALWCHTERERERLRLRKSEWEGTRGAEGGRESGSPRAEQSTSVRATERSRGVRDRERERQGGREIRSHNENQVGLLYFCATLDFTALLGVPLFSYKHTFSLSDTVH